MRCMMGIQFHDHHRWTSSRRLASGALLAALAACGDPPPPEPVIRPVRAVVARAAGADQVRAFSGVARAGVESTLSFRVGGVISRVAVRVGEGISAGALIAELDPVDYELQVREAEAALRQAEARAGNAAADLRRVRSLYENDNASRTDLDAAMAASDSAAAQVESTGQRLDLVRRQLGYTRLAAPVAGAIAAVAAEANETVTPGTPIVVLAASGPPEVGFAVAEALIREIRAGMAATIQFDSIPGERFDGTVTEVGVASTAVGTTFPVTVRLDGAAGIRSGMAALVEIVFPGDDSSPRFVLPGQAVAEDQAGRFVFVAEPSGDGLAEVRRREVTVAGFAADGIEVTSGIEEGDQVVTAGVGRLLDGDIVRLGPAGAR